MTTFKSPDRFYTPLDFMPSEQWREDAALLQAGRERLAAEQAEEIWRRQDSETAIDPNLVASQVDQAWSDHLWVPGVELEAAVLYDLSEFERNRLSNQ